MSDVLTNHLARAVALYEPDLGNEIGVSRWFAVNQHDVDSFAEISHDLYFIHTDPERAKAETEFGGTIAHGFFTLALLSAMAYDAVPKAEGARIRLNYGFDRIRFISPVRIGERVRGRFRLDRIEPGSGGKLLLHYGITIEIEGRERPAVIGQWISYVAFV